MLRKNKKGIYEFSEFKLAGLVHGFSTRNADLEKKDLVLMEQTHGNKIKKVFLKDKGQVIREVDGLATSEKGLILGVKTADCLPILFYEPLAKIVGVVHAGWRGTFKQIAVKMVKLVIKMGGLPSELLVAIGPHIGKCCYRLNLLELNLTQLIHSGVRPKNVFASLLCTSCHTSEFFSYNKEKEKAGRMLSIIGLKDD